MPNVLNYKDILCIVVTYLLISQSQITSSVVFYHFKRLGIAIPIIGISVHLCFAAIAIWCQWACMTQDPGIVPKITDEQTIEDALNFKFTLCKKCDSLRPVKAHHCKICNACILRMDHHCLLSCIKIIAGPWRA
ncbi:Palmitoyltransferase [Babesia duncani]|uniref:Palmitoyltransferase n=1 Tax=Babesia duncani TaxID=323732 RepID=A0AAD9UM76_9APIC|nr:Palmitoyltransferase [Babesia duncani]